MDLEARLRAFAAVARRGSFSRAAVDLGISQPAVSKHVADLEAALGTRLFVREPRGARLTEPGEFLASYVSRAEALLARATAGVASLADAESGRLTFAASGIPGVYLLPRAIGPFAAARPGVELDMRLGTSAEAVSLVRSHVAELAITGGTVAGTDLEVEPLLEDEIVIVGPPSMNGARNARELERHTWISREEGSGTRSTTEVAMESLGLRPGRRLALPDWEVIKGAVAAGAGVAAISRFAVEHELAGGRLGLIELPGWHVVRPLSLVRSRDVPLTPLGDHFVATIRRVLGGQNDRLDRARAALAYAERADGRASISEVQGTLAEGIAWAGTDTVEERGIGARMRSLLAFWQVKGGDFAAARATVEAGLRVADLPPDARADLLSREGWIALRVGPSPRAAHLLEEALVAARAASSDAVERRAMLDLAVAYSDLGRSDEARSLLEDAIARSRDAGDSDELLRAYNNGAVILEAVGDPGSRADADALLLEGADAARTVGDRHHLGWMQLNVAVGLIRRGLLRDAEHRLEEALAIFEELGELGAVPPASITLAWVKLLLDETEVVEPLLARGAEDRYGGSSDTPLPGVEVRAMLRWRTEPLAALAELHAAATAAAARGAADTARSWHLVARMALRCGDAGRVAEAADAVGELALLTTEERRFPEWLAALRDPEARTAVPRLEALAADLESLESVLDAADAFADAAFIARRAPDRSFARSLLAARDRLLARAGAVSILD